MDPDGFTRSESGRILDSKTNPPGILSERTLGHIRHSDPTKWMMMHETGQSTSNYVHHELHPMDETMALRKQCISIGVKQEAGSIRNNRPYIETFETAPRARFTTETAEKHRQDDNVLAPKPTNSSIGAGDLRNNLAKLQTELKHVRYDVPLDQAGASRGDPAAFLPILHYVLLDYSALVARRFAERSYELYGKTDSRFVETVFGLMLNEFNYRSALSRDQFLSPGFAERKLILVADVVRLCRELHGRLKRAASAARAAGASGLSAGGAQALSSSGGSSRGSHVIAARHSAPSLRLHLHALRHDAPPGPMSARPSASANLFGSGRRSSASVGQPRQGLTLRRSGSASSAGSRRDRPESVASGSASPGGSAQANGAADSGPNGLAPGRSGTIELARGRHRGKWACRAR
nr:Centrosomal protein of 44 kDa [Polyrhizophydium stewartii]